VLGEIRRMTSLPGWKGTISDIGGPSANMWGARCLADPEACARESCLVPKICPKFASDQLGFVSLLREATRLPGVKNVRVASGWRIDLALAEKEALRAMVREFVGGQAKVAPEHKSGKVLSLMRKPDFTVFEQFLRLFEEESKRAGKEQYVIPYLMSAFPGCADEDMRDLADWLAARGWKPRQVQCFIPLPGTMAAAMFFAGADLDGKPLKVARTDAERLRQHGILVPAVGRGAAGRKPGFAKSEGAGKSTRRKPGAGKSRK